jgi:hypothetical protein
MTINYTTLLGLAKPVTGTEANTWGDVVNDSITSLLDTAIAGTTTLTADTTLTTTTGAQRITSRQAVLVVFTSFGKHYDHGSCAVQDLHGHQHIRYLHSYCAWCRPDHRCDFGCK